MKIMKFYLLIVSFHVISSTLIAIPTTNPATQTTAVSSKEIDALQQAAENAKKAAKSLHVAVEHAKAGVKKGLEQATRNAKNALQKLHESVLAQDPLAKAIMATDWVSVRRLLSQDPKPKLAFIVAAKSIAEAELLYAQSKPYPDSPEITALERIIYMLDKAIKEY